MRIALFDPAKKGEQLALSNGNRTVYKDISSSYFQTCLMDMSFTSGKHYYECVVGDDQSIYTNISLGFATPDFDPVVDFASRALTYIDASGIDENTQMVYAVRDNVTFIGDWADINIWADDILGIAVDFDNGLYWISLNNDWDPDSIGYDPVTSTLGFPFSANWISGDVVWPGVSVGQNTRITLATDKTQLTYAAPSGFTEGLFIGSLSSHNQSYADAYRVASQEQIYNDALFKQYFEQIYHAATLFLPLEQTYGDNPMAGFVQQYGLKAGMELIASYQTKLANKGVLLYGDSFASSILHRQLYGNAPITTRANPQTFGDVLISKTSLIQLSDALASVSMPNQQDYIITEGVVSNDNDQSFDMHTNEKVVLSHDDYYSMIEDDSNIQSIDTLFVSAVLNSAEEIKFSNIDISSDIQSYAISLSADLENAGEYQKITRGDLISITIGTDVFNFLIESKSRTRAHGSTTYSIDGISLTALLDVPYALPINRSWDVSAEASTIANDLLNGAFTLDWTLIDWVVPANTLYATQESPISIIRKLAKVAGGVLQTSPDGTTLYVRKKYEVSPPTEGPIIFNLADTLNFFTTSETYEHKEGFNKVIVTNQNTSDPDKASLGQIEIDATTYEVRGTQVPFVGDFNLKTSGGSWVSIETVGIVKETITEEIEIVAGRGSAANPIYGYSDIVWKQEVLGTITTSEDGTIETSVVGQSLIELTYVTKYKKWIVRSPEIENVQFYIEEE